MSATQPIIFCELSEETQRLIADYVNSLKQIAPSIGAHGMTEEDFWSSGLFQSAVERLRGTQSATTEKKRTFIADILRFMQAQGAITDWKFSGSGERHDYEVRMPGGWLCVIEAKGCLDGNNTNIFERPPNADEFIIWSLCQNPGSDPRHNAWSGIHTRLSAEIIHRRQRVDGLIIWDMVCGTKGRICPKLVANPSRAIITPDREVPPPCVYLFPRTIPDPRNNPQPKCWRLNEVKFLHALIQTFKGDNNDVVEVRIEARMSGTSVERRTVYVRDGQEISQSKWTKLKRAR
jgi:hypothetical protein